MDSQRVAGQSDAKAYYETRKAPWGCFFASLWLGARCKLSIGRKLISSVAAAAAPRKTIKLIALK